MARYSDRDTSPILEAAGRWAKTCLEGDGSIFGQDQVWTADNFALLDQHFVQRPNDGPGDFFEKLATQLSDAPPGVSKLMSELLWAMFLFPSNVGADKKREGIARAWSFSGSELDLNNPFLTDDVLAGIGSAGTAFNTMRWWELLYAISLFTSLKTMPPGQRLELVSNYEQLSDWLEKLPREGDRQYRHMLRFLLFPDQVERMSSNGDRRRVLLGFGVANSREMKNWSDRQFDDAMQALRRRLESEKGSSDLDFYSTELMPRWKTAKAEPMQAGAASKFNIGYNELRERFLQHMPGLTSFASHTSYVSTERAYKDELVDLFEEAVAPQIRQADWLAAGRAAIALLTRPLRHASNKPQNIVGWRYIDLVRKLDEQRCSTFGKCLAELIDEESPIEERVDDFVDALSEIVGPEHAVAAAAQRSITSFYLTLASPDKHLFLKTQEMQQAFRRLDPSFQWSSGPLRGSDVVRAESIAEQVFERLQAEGWQPKDLIDVQTFLWVAVGYGDVNRVAEMDSEEIEETLPSVRSNAKAAVRPLNRIYFGPPGTGKTYTLQQLLKSDYSEASATIDPHVWRAEQIASRIGSLTWWEALGAALHDLARPATVPELAQHPFIAAVASAKRRTGGIRATLWGTLQNHAPIESTTVNLIRRLPPFIFDKSSDSAWQLVGPWKDALADTLESLDNIKQGPKATDAPLERHSFVTFHQSFSYEDFMEGLTPIADEITGKIRYQVKKGAFLRLCERARLDPDHAYAMVIDEINRGNVSKVFGELITLIEPDKRAGALNALSVTLPYSGESFSVPANVHLIGSMNTADRSLAGLDIALRRRFQFVEVPPQSERLKGINIAGVEMSALLDVMNQRISILLDRDHCLGHGYFMSLGDNPGLTELAALFRQQIVPLLQEYFFEDWQRIAWVLNDHRKPKGLRFVVKAESPTQSLFGTTSEIPVDANLWALDEEAFSNIESYRGIVNASDA